MRNTLPLNEFIIQRREDMGIKTRAELARLAGTTRSTISDIEIRTEPPTKAYKSVYHGIAKALKVSPNELLAATKTWVADEDKLKPEFILPPDEGDEATTHIVPFGRFLKKRRLQLGFKSQAALASAMKRQNSEINGAETGRVGSDKLSQRLLEAYAQHLNLDLNEWLKAAKIGDVTVNNVCLDPPLRGDYYCRRRGRAEARGSVTEYYGGLGGS